MLVPNTVSLSGMPPAAQVQRSAAPVAPDFLATAFVSLDIENYHAWAWANYKHVVRDLCKRFAAHRLIEIGGGRDPLFDRQEIDSLGVEMTVNDIATGELAALPTGYRTACFDVAGDISGVTN